MELLRGNIKTLYFKYLSAAFGSALISSIYGIVDMAMVGQYQGPDGTAALAVVAPVWNVIYSIGLLMGIGGSVIFSTKRGSGMSADGEDEQYFTAAVIGSVILAALAWIGLILFERPLLMFFGTDETLLALAQSSISKMVADLESEWGMTLLERSKSGVCLTSAGEQVMPFLRKVLNDHQELVGQIDRMNGIETGVVRIGTFASVAINWLPNIFAVLQKDYPGIEYEMLLGDYDEVEHWIDEGRVDCGFLRLPTLPKFDTLLLKQDEYKAVLPMGHPLAAKETVAVEELDGLPFLLLEHGGKTEVSDLLERTHVQPDVRFTTWEDFAIMAMVGKGLGVSILPDLILQRIPYRIEVRPLQQPYYRPIVLAMKQQAHLTPAVQKFIEYLSLREAQR